MPKTKRLTLTRGQNPFPIVSIGDVAILSGQKLDTIRHWMLRLGAPAPIGRSAAGALYWWPDWLEWFAAKRPAVLAAMSNGGTPESAPAPIKPGPPCNSDAVDSCADCECTADECDLREES